MSKMMDSVLKDFTEENVEKGFRECNGYLNSRNVYVKRKENGEIERVDVTFLVPTGKRADLYMDIAFTDESEELVRVYGKQSLTCTDAERVALAFSNITALWMHRHNQFHELT